MKALNSILFSALIIIFIVLLFYLNNPCQNSLSQKEKDLVLYFQFNEENYRQRDGAKFICDLSGNNNNGKIYRNSDYKSEGISKEAFKINSINSIIVKDSKELSPSNSKNKFTITFFVKIKNTSFAGDNLSYINFIGKGNYEQGYEYLFREYNSSNTENRSDRLSFYAFNSSGGFGAGSYFQEKINPDEWIFISGVINEDNISIYKNGILKDSRPLSEYAIKMKDTSSGLYISDINGTIDELRIYKRALNEEEIKTIYENSL